MTIAEALQVTDRTVSFRDAEVFLAEALSCDRAFLHAHPEKEISTEVATRYESFLTRRETNEPVAYIIGHKEFYGRPFLCDSRALIPRPETEGLVEHTLSHAEEVFATHTEFPCPVQILELGTGCGCIAISLALKLAEKNIPATILATDISAEALALANENWQQLGTSNGNIQIKFIEADLFNHPDIAKKPFNLIVANLPYVEDTWKMNPAAQPEVVFREPDIALFGGADGLDVYRRFFSQVQKFLAQTGYILIEYGEGQTKTILPLISNHLPGGTFNIQQDYAGLDRIIEIKMHP